MHILFLTDNFPPEVNAPASRTFEHCKHWIAAGHQVTIITCAPNFPSGRVFEGYRNRFIRKEKMGGIDVVRVWTYIAANQGFAKRIADYVSFMFMSIFASLFVRRVDVIVGTSPQFFTACAARIVSSLKRKPWFFELRDIWPESIKAVGALGDSVIIRFLEYTEIHLYRHASKIIAVTHSFKENLVNRGIPADKIDVITNGVDLSHYSPRAKDSDLEKQLGLEGKFIAGYIGTHGMAHALETLIDAAELLSKRADAADIHVLLLGDGARKSELEAYAVRRSLKNISFVSSVPKDQVPRYWSLLDLSIIHLKRTELFNAVIPSKLFECMGMGIPVLLGLKGEAAAIVEKEQVGEIFEPENPAVLADKIIALRDDTHRFNKFRKFGPVAACKYDRSKLAADMLSSLTQLGKK